MYPTTTPVNTIGSSTRKALDKHEILLVFTAKGRRNRLEKNLPQQAPRYKCINREPLSRGKKNSECFMIYQPPTQRMKKKRSCDIRNHCLIPPHYRSRFHSTVIGVIYYSVRRLDVGNLITKCKGAFSSQVDIEPRLKSLHHLRGHSPMHLCKGQRRWSRCLRSVSTSIASVFTS